MITDTINDEILRIKRELSSAHGNDIALIAADARSRQAHVVSHEPRRIKSEQNGQREAKTPALP